MCTTCDGRIPFDAMICPYCAGEQVRSAPPAIHAKELHHQSLQDSLTSLYTPPYAGKGLSNLGGEKKECTNGLNFGSGAYDPKLNLNKPEPPKDTMADKRFNPSSLSLGAPTIPVDSAEEQQLDEGRSSFWPILLLSIGANLLTIGLLQLLFSDNGFLRLEWDSGYWFAYCLAALPLFFFGFKKANLLK